jgi:hypothetical protein
MTADERLKEIAEILANGLLRLRRCHSERHASDLERNRLDFSRGRSVHATTLKRRQVRR